MADLKQIKKRIYDEELVVKVLEALQCENIKEEQNGKLYTAQLPIKFNSSNLRAVQIRNKENLSAHIRNRGIKGDIYSIIGYILFNFENFHKVREGIEEIQEWLYEVLEWDSFDGTDEITSYKKDYNQWLRKIKKDRMFRVSRETLKKKQNKIINERNLSRYIEHPHYQFRRDGILWKTQKEFKIGYDVFSNRVTYPVYNKWGQLIGVKGRIVGEHKHVAGMQKYLYLIPCDKSIELFNLHRAKQYILKQEEVLVFESAKSVMLAHQYGYKNSVSLEGSDLSPYQAFLLKELNARIIFCFDKDVEKNEIVEKAKEIKNRLCYMIVDKYDLLDDKMSPVDKGKKVWEKLYQKCTEKIEQDVR
jgi:DNA primase